MIANAVTDAHGFYSVAELPVGPLQVKVEAPTNYQTDPSAKAATIVEQTVTTVDFELRLGLPRPPTSNGRDVTVSTDGAGCTGLGSIDPGSSDPDGDLLGCTQFPAGPYGVGASTVTLTCTDATGLSSACVGQVTVMDVNPPVIACPADMTVQTLGTTGIADFAPIGSDNCGPPTVSCSPASGTSLPLGDVAINCVATDGAGNVASCDFNAYANAPPNVICLAASVQAGPQCEGAASIDSGVLDPDGDTWTCEQFPTSTELLR